MLEVVKMLPIVGTNHWDPMIFCPACQRGHVFSVAPIHATGHRWGWNGDKMKPTFTPSMMIYDGEGKPECHSVITDGMIAFQTDCSHGMRGQTVPLAPFTQEEW